MARSTTRAKWERGRDHSHHTPLAGMVSSVGLFGLSGAFATHVFGWDLTTLLAVAGGAGATITVIRLLLVEIEESGPNA